MKESNATLTSEEEQQGHNTLIDCIFHRHDNRLLSTTAPLLNITSTSLKHSLRDDLY